MNVSTTLFRVFSIETLKNVVKILFLLVSLAILLAFHVIAQLLWPNCIQGITGQR
jgi:flagellar biosynthesis protein FlhB